jgi:hypothetical protein
MPNDALFKVYNHCQQEKFLYQYTGSRLANLTGTYYL